MRDAGEIRALNEMARRVRLNILELVGVGRAGHLGGSNSAADIVTALYFGKMRYDAQNLFWPLRDRLLLSKGHAALCQYAALCEMGVVPREALPTVKSLGSILQGHPDMTRCPGIEANTGSLGQGLSVALGIALGLRLDGTDSKVYCMLGDGELAEGQVWEAMMAAASYRARNLIGIVDANGVQATDAVCRVLDQGELGAKFRAFGWRVIEIDGHDMAQILGALDAADEPSDGPTMILAHTVKGKGVDFAEGKAAFHNGSLTQEQFDSAREQIETGGGSSR